MDKKDFLEFDSNSNIKILPLSMDFTSLYPSTMTFYLSKRKNKRLNKIKKILNGINTKGEI